MIIRTYEFLTKPFQMTEIIEDFRCPVCGGSLFLPGGTGCNGFHFGTYC